MSWLKDIFFKKEEKIIDTKENIEVKDIGESIGICAICKNIVGKEERVRNFNGHPCHKRCVKKITKSLMKGENFEQAIKNAE